MWPSHPHFTAMYCFIFLYHKSFTASLHHVSVKEPLIQLLLLNLKLLSTVWIVSGCLSGALGDQKAWNPLAQYYSKIDENAFSVCSNSFRMIAKWHGALLSATITLKPSLIQNPLGEPWLYVHSTDLSWDELDGQMYGQGEITQILFLFLFRSSLSLSTDAGIIGLTQSIF